MTSKNTFAGITGSDASKTSGSGGSIGSAGIQGTNAYVTTMSRPQNSTGQNTFPTPLINVPNIAMQLVSTAPSGFNKLTNGQLDITGTAKSYTNYADIINDFVGSLNRCMATFYTLNVNGASPSNGIYYKGGLTNDNRFTITPVWNVVPAPAECTAQWSVSVYWASAADNGTYRYQKNPNLYYDYLLAGLFTTGWVNCTIGTLTAATALGYRQAFYPSTVFSGNVMTSRYVSNANCSSRNSGTTTTVTSSIPMTGTAINFNLNFYTYQYGAGTNGYAKRWVLETSNAFDATGTAVSGNTTPSKLAPVQNSVTLSIPPMALTSNATFVNAVVSALNAQINTILNSLKPANSGGNNFGFTDNANGFYTTANPNNTPWYLAYVDNAGIINIAANPAKIAGSFLGNSGATPGGGTATVWISQDPTMDSSNYSASSDQYSALYKACKYFPYDFNPIITYPAFPTADQPSASIIKGLLGGIGNVWSELDPATYVNSSVVLPFPTMLGYGKAERIIDSVTTVAQGSNPMSPSYNSIPVYTISSYFLQSPKPVSLPSPTYGNLLNIGDNQVNQTGDPVVTIGSAQIANVYTTTIGAQPASTAYIPGLGNAYPTMTIQGPIKYSWLQNAVTLCGGIANNPQNVNNYALYAGAGQQNYWMGMNYNMTVNGTATNYTTTPGSQVAPTSLSVTSAQQVGNPFISNGMPGLYIQSNLVFNGTVNNDYFYNGTGYTQTRSYQSVFTNNDTVPHRYLVQNISQVDGAFTYNHYICPVFAAGKTPSGDPQWTNASQIGSGAGINNQSNCSGQCVWHPSPSSANIGNSANANINNTGYGIPTTFNVILQPGECFMLLVMGGDQFQTGCLLHYVTNTNRPFYPANSCNIVIF